jgi:hypothetical protein
MGEDNKNRNGLGFKDALNTMTTQSNDAREVSDVKDNIKTYELYPIRWAMIVFFTTSISASGLGMVGFSAITPIISDIYGVSGLVTTMLVLPFIILFIPCIFPANYLIDKTGIRIPVYLASATLLAGAWIRLLVNTSFSFVVLGQVIMALGQPFMLSAPAKLASLWFGDNERAIATTLGSLAAPIGAVTGFLLPLPLISESDAMPIEHGKSVFFRYILIQNIIITVLAIPIIFLIRNNPPTPPSKSAAKAMQAKSVGQCRSIRELLKNVSFAL